MKQLFFVLLMLSACVELQKKDSPLPTNAQLLRESNKTSGPAPMLNAAKDALEVFFLNAPPPGEGELSLAALKKQVMGHTLHPSYLLIRRLSILEQLEELSPIPQAQCSTAITKFCQGLSQSLPEEKPLLISSPAWQEAFCSLGDWEVHQRAHRLGFGYGLQELVFFQKLAGLVSRKGQLQVHIPQAGQTFKDLWLRLSPGEEVAKKLVQEGTKIAEGPFEALLLKPEYLSNTLVGETSFAMSNGRMKLLELPQGHYRYTLYDLPEEHANWAPTESKKSSHGSFTWLEAPHKVLISTWTPTAEDDSHLVGR